MKQETKEGAGLFVVLEGPDGSGKTTLAHALEDRLRSRGGRVLFTFEPTRDSPYGPEIRAMLTGAQAADPLRTAERMTSDRAWHVENVVLPALRAGTTVLCDRYKYSSIVYQRTQGVPLERLLAWNSPFPAPDAVFILRPRSADTLLERIQARGARKERFEERAVLERIVRLYEEIPELFPGENILFLDAEQPVSRLAEAAEAFLSGPKPDGGPADAPGL